MPEEVLGPRGYITINQSNLRSLSLAVDGACPGFGLEGLIQLNNLHHFSWRGIVTKHNFKLLRTVLEHNAHHLLSLDVEVVRRFGPPRDADDIELDLFWLGLLVPKSRHTSRFAEGRLIKNEFRLSRLLSLTLRNVSLAAWKIDDELTFDPAILVRLILEYCPKTLRFFETWHRRNHRLSLVSFRGIIDENWGRRASFPLELLLNKYGSRLEEYYITFTDNPLLNINFQVLGTNLKRMILSFFKKRQGVRSEINLPESLPIRRMLESLPTLEGVAFTRSPHFVVGQYEQGPGQ
jgi:hypothetical protein